MPILTITKTYLDGNTLTEAMLDDIKDSVETFLNVTGIDDTNIADLGVSKGKLTAAAQLFMVPTGMMMHWPVAAIPGGWLECLGQEVSQSTYSALFTVLGTTWNNFNGAADPSAGNFRLPNPQGMVLGAAGTYTDTVSGSITRTLATTVGAEKHLLTSGETGTVAHTHGFTTGGESATHTHSTGEDGTTVGGATPNMLGVGFGPSTTNTSANSNDHTHSGTTNASSSASAGSAHTIMQPTMFIKVIIKI